METYFFTCSSGWIGGSGVVKAENIDEALTLANIAIMNYGTMEPQPITKEELTLVLDDSAVLITNGEY